VQSVERALDVLEALASAGKQMGVSELGQVAGLPYATIHRLTATLVTRGYVRQDPRSRKYLLGARLVKLGASAGRVLGDWIQPYLQELVDLTGETANLALLEDGDVVYVAQVSSGRMMRMFTEVGQRVPPHGTAVGKVLLAHQPRQAVERILERNGLPAATPNTTTDPDALLTELDLVRTQGYALDMEEQEVGVCCVAVPALPMDGWVAAMSVSGPTGRMGQETRGRIIADMVRVSERLTASMAANPPHEPPPRAPDPGAPLS
jgi:IclR family acetate operon transcriptional repressor